MVAQLLSRLAERHWIAVVYLGAPDLPAVDAGLASRCDLVERVDLPHSGRSSSWRRRLDVLLAPVSGLPSAVARLHTRRLVEAVQTVAGAWKPDVIQIEHDLLAYCVPHLGNLGAARLLVCHEPGLTAAEDLALHTSGRQQIAHRLDAAAWRRYWLRTLPALDAIIAFTADDLGSLRRVAPQPRLLSIPLGIDPPPRPSHPTGFDEPAILFFGGYSHPPNADAALRLIQAIMPLARRQVPDLRLRLVGDKPTVEMSRLAGPRDEVTSGVADVQPYLDQAALVALPLRLGGGMRVKLLESLAAGKAVVASPLAARGLELANGREVVLAETDQQFAQAIVTLIADPDARRSLARHAREWALRNLDWESRARRYEELYRRLSRRGRFVPHAHT